LAIRVRLLELFTLHVLPRNDEWEYAREFINMSEVLDEDRKEAFIQTLDSLLEEKERGTQRAAEIQREKEEELERQRQEREEMEREEEEARRRAESTQQQQQQQGGQRKAAAETDYGIDKSHPNGAASKTRTPKPALKPSRVASQSHRQQQPGSNRASKATAQKPLFFFTRLRLLANLLVRTVKNMASSMSANPLAFLRSLLIVLGFVMALARQDVRERIRRVTGAGWQKVRGTVGMGVKVSYI
jgi:flagellar biosynthesis GTPase FlhF